MASSMKSSKKLSREERLALIEDLLTRSVAEVIPSKEDLRALLLSNKKLKIYIGTDATGTSLHLGHSTNYIVLEKFRRLGHKVIFLIGDFTARIGDPSDKDATRKQLTRAEVKKNVSTWLKQVAPIINLKDKENPVMIKYNHDWLSKLNFEDIIGLASNFTVKQMIERDMFERRIKEEKPIYLHEFFYPLMQGYDSCAMDVDIELCGNDQKFNALAGRTLQKRLNNREKFVFITTLLVNPITGEKMMSKSKGTGVFLDVSAKDMFGGIMSQADENIIQLFIDCTNIPMSEINKIESNLKSNNLNPREAKVMLAKEITSMYHGEKMAEKAMKEFDAVFARKEMPTDIKELSAPFSSANLIDVIVFTGIVNSKSDARRLILQGGIKINGEKNMDIKKDIVITKEGVVIQIGKRNFIKIKKA